MSGEQRLPTSARVSYVPPTYEDLEVKYESKETPESHLLHVHIPDGFTRQHIGAKVEFEFGRVRVFGERPLGNNKSSRFNVLYQVPESCDVNGIKGQFDGRIATITMQKKVISKEAPEPPAQEPQPTEQEAPEPPAQEPQPTEQEAPEPPVQETGPDTEKDQEEKSIADEVSDQDAKSDEKADHETSKTLPEPTDESMPKEGQEGFPQDAKLDKEENGEKQMVGKEEIIEHREVDEISNEKRKESGTCVPKTAEKEHLNEINGKFGGGGDEGSYGTIKGVTASATRAVISLKKRFNEDDKQKLVYVGAAVLAMALGVYASYKFHSIRRP